MLFALVFLLSLLVVCFAIPSIISVSFKKRLFDDPADSRKVHKVLVPTFGGIAIFTGFLFSAALLIPAQLIPEVNVLMAAGLLIFMVGLQDDVVGLSPTIKFMVQLVSAAITIGIAGLRITDLNGFLGMQELPEAASILLTTVFVVGIVNAFNLIDGIDGLAGSLSIIASLSFALLFFLSGNLGWAYLSLSLAGALLGFLFFNITPAKIFMGDSGSLSVGFIVALFSLKFLQVATPGDLTFGAFQMKAEAALVLSILIIPIFDTLRVLLLRILKNSSPFIADNNHLHHRLLFLGLSHAQATLVLSVVNVLFILMAVLMQRLGNTQLIGLIVLSMLSLNGALSLYIEHYKKMLFASKDARLKSKDNAYYLSAISKRDLEQEVFHKISDN